MLYTHLIHTWRRPNTGDFSPTREIGEVDGPVSVTVPGYIPSSLHPRDIVTLLFSVDGCGGRNVTLSSLVDNTNSIISKHIKISWNRIILIVEMIVILSGTKDYHCHLVIRYKIEDILQNFVTETFDGSLIELKKYCT